MKKFGYHWMDFCDSLYWGVLIKLPTKFKLGKNLKKIKRILRQQTAATCSRWFLARGFFYPEDGGDTFLRNVGSFHTIYTAPRPRR
jgi:hypothetical protein